MKGHLVSVGFVAAVLTTDTSAASVADRLKVLRDKARPIIILSDSDDDPRVARQISAFDKAKAALGERDIAILRETKPRSALRRSLGVPEIGFAVVLVGKDGSVKQVWRDTVTPNAIVRIVDAMAHAAGRNDAPAALALTAPLGWRSVPVDICGYS